MAVQLRRTWTCPVNPRRGCAGVSLRYSGVKQATMPSTSRRFVASSRRVTVASAVESFVMVVSVRPIRYSVPYRMTGRQGPMARRRAYDASGRQARAAERREVVLESARRLFLERGYASTSLPSVAADAGVSLEYLHKTFGGK